MNWAWIGLLIDSIAVVTVCVLIFFIIKSLIHYCHSSSRNDKLPAQTKENQRVTIHDL